MGLVLLNLKTKQQIELDVDKPIIIGRKNIIECEDKRVSRCHGKIKYTRDGKVILCALHSNPCFFTRNGVPPVKPLNKDEEETLREGDCLGLLPDSFWFQITTKENCEKLNFNKSSDVNKLYNFKDEEVKTQNITAEAIGSDLHQTVSKNVSVLEKECKSLEVVPSVSNAPAEPGTSTSTTPTWGYGSLEFEKTRRLPLWMYQIDEPINSRNTLQKTTVLGSPKFEEPKPKRLKTEIGSQFDKPSTSTLIKEDVLTAPMNECEMSNDSNGSLSLRLADSNEFHTESSRCKDGSNYAKSKDDCECDVEPEPCIKRRPICCYEYKCYRKNAQHKLDFCHPGDADYVVYENRPMCKYGSSCYRRNQLHRVEFRHPTDSADNDRVDNFDDNDSYSLSCSPSPEPSPLPAKRRRKPVKRQGINSGEDDLDSSDVYDLEDPFVNDASSDEYVPGDMDTDQESDYFDD